MTNDQRLRAPAENGAVLAVPALASVSDLLADNRRRLANPSLQLLGLSLQDLRQQAHQTTLAAARAYLRAAGEPLPDGNADSLVLAGHQPVLFHPGVWIKN